MLQYRSIAKTMNGKAPKRCRQKRVLMIPAHYRIKASDAFGPGSPHRLRWHERQSREVAPADTKTEYALVAQLDSVSASDAFGPGSPHRLRWHERQSREVAPADTKTEYALVAQLDSAPTLKVVGAPDAAGVARAQNKARPNGNAPLREVSPPFITT